MRISGRCLYVRKIIEAGMAFPVEGRDTDPGDFDGVNPAGGSNLCTAHLEKRVGRGTNIHDDGGFALLCSADRCFTGMCPLSGNPFL